MLQTVLPVYCAKVCRASRDVNDLAGARPTKAETSKRLKPSLAQCLNAVIQVKFDVFYLLCLISPHTLDDVLTMQHIAAGSFFVLRHLFWLSFGVSVGVAIKTRK